MHEILKCDPSVFVVGQDYQIIFLTESDGLGWVEIGNTRFDTEESGILKYGTVHSVRVPGSALNAAKEYTVVFWSYPEKQAYFPEGREVLRRTYRFYPFVGGAFRIFQFADTHGRLEQPLETFRSVPQCDLLVLNGDINDHCEAREQLCGAFMLSAGAVHGTRPVIYARGNHDTRGRFAQDLLDYIPTDVRDGRRETFYSFRQGELWGLVLDCGEDKPDSHPEYGGTVCFDAFRQRETHYLESILENREREFDAPGVRHRIAICHIPFIWSFEEPFNIEQQRYAHWVELLNCMGIDLLLCGHMHKTYCIAPHTPGFLDAEFSTAVLSVPEATDREGKTVYVGGEIVCRDGRLAAGSVPNI